MIFNEGDKVIVNLGGLGSHKGTVISSHNDKQIFVHLDGAQLPTCNLDPWDVFHIDEEGDGQENH